MFDSAKRHETELFRIKCPPARPKIRRLRALGLALVCGIGLGLASGCVRADRGIVDSHGDTPPYVMPLF
jgi:hypothetical protein